MPRFELYLDEADKLIREEAFEEAATWLGRHLEEHEYSQESKMAVSWRLRDISERLMERREFSGAFNYYDSYLNLAKSLLSADEYRNAIVFVIGKCRWIIDIQTNSNSFDVARKYFDKILKYGNQLNETRTYNGILSYIVEKYIEEMKKRISDRTLFEKLKREADKYIGMITDNKIRDDLRNKRVVYKDKTRIY
jgi:hypothetical protein